MNANNKIKKRSVIFILIMTLVVSVALDTSLACFAEEVQAKEGAQTQVGNTETPPTDYQDLNAVVKAFDPKMDKSLNQGDGTWLDFAYPKGGQTTLSYEHKNKLVLEEVTLKFLDLRTKKVYSSDYFTRRLTKFPKSGTVIAYPRSGFEVEKEFTYLGQNSQKRKVVLHGKLVNVKVIIGYPAGATKLPSELVCKKSVQNLAHVGMAIPDNVGKAGKIRSLLETAKMRYGATAAKAFYEANPEGKVQILLTGVDKEKAQEVILPATY